METFSALLAICAGNSPISGEFPAQRPVTRSFDVLFDMRLNKPLSKQPYGWWLETLSRPLWRHCDVFVSVCSSVMYTKQWDILIVYAAMSPLPDESALYTCKWYPYQDITPGTVPLVQPGQTA